jgi:hypothetical protein
LDSIVNNIGLNGEVYYAMSLEGEYIIEVGGGWWTVGKEATGEGASECRDSMPSSTVLQKVKIICGFYTDRISNPCSAGNNQVSS